jgi:hypothetical protein
MGACVVTHYPHRCDICGRKASHCEVCHRVARAAAAEDTAKRSREIIARAVARLADHLGYEETAREMRELLEDFESPGGEVREVELGGALG